MQSILEIYSFENINDYFAAAFVYISVIIMLCVVYKFLQTEAIRQLTD